MFVYVFVSSACTAPSERAVADSPVAETSSFAVYTVAAATAAAAADPKNDAEEEAGDAGVPADTAEAAASATEPTTTGAATAEAKTTGKASQSKVLLYCTGQHDSWDIQGDTAGLGPGLG